MEESSLAGEKFAAAPRAYKRTPSFQSRFPKGMRTFQGPVSHSVEYGHSGESSGQVKESTHTQGKKDAPDPRKLLGPEYAAEA